MNPNDLSNLETSFNQLAEKLQTHKPSPAEFTLKLNGERSQFTRFNHAQVRQTGSVADGWVQLTLINDSRSAYRQFPFTGDFHQDWQQAEIALQELQQELPTLPADPYVVLPTGNNQSREVNQGNLLTSDDLAATILTPVSGLDFTGIYAGGVVIKAYADSCGQRHWFATDTFTLDYSLFNSDGKAVKGFVAGSNWDLEQFTSQIQAAKQQLQLLSRPVKSIPKGQYRTYFAPAAIADLAAMLSWGGISEADIQQGNSSLTPLARHEKTLSPKFTLMENFQRGLVPRFNEFGEMTDVQLPVFANGVLVNTLINSRTAKEYGKVANGANSSESLRALEIAPGSLSSSEIFSRLDTGLYVSNLHYLNWSDLHAGRITGMTRYACFWVSGGEIVAPIEDLRFDDTLYRFWGENLLDLTDFQEFIPEVGTYEGRHLGGSVVPGMLIEDFTYTL